MLQKLYKLLFWSGYTSVLLVSTLTLPWALDEIHIGKPEFYIRLDHLLHFSVYFLICMYYLFGRKKGLNLFLSRPTSHFLTAILLLATITEFVQLWVPTRSFNIMDWVANVSGIFLGMVVIKIKDRRLKN
jgi:VanZ family protein